jgi:general secretion pathway protein D
VVIGGLMQDSKSVTDSKVPIVGDIPLLGMLFKHKITANAKTELVIFVTPTVVKTPSDLSRMSTDETSRTEMAPRAFPLSERDNYIDPDAPNAGSAPAAETAVSPRRMP